MPKPTIRRVRRKPKGSSDKVRPKKRHPMVGLLQPQQSIVLMIDPPMAANEQPVVLTPNAGDVLLRDALSDRVTIVNQTDRIVGYLMTVVPSMLIHVATTPWKRIAKDLKAAVQDSGTLDRLAQVVSGFVKSSKK